MASAMLAVSSKLWLATSTVVPVSFIESSIFQSSSLAAGSSERLGSSSNSTAGDFKIARAIPKRCSMPLENFIACLSASLVRLTAASTSSIRRGMVAGGSSSKTAKNLRFSRAVSRGKNERSAPTANPTTRLTASSFFAVSCPPTRTNPESGRRIVESSLSSVVFPLPFGPKRTPILPVSNFSETPSNARVSDGHRHGRAHSRRPKIFVTDWISIIAISALALCGCGRHCLRARFAEYVPEAHGFVERRHRPGKPRRSEFFFTHHAHHAKRIRPPLLSVFPRLHDPAMPPHRARFQIGSIVSRQALVPMLDDGIRKLRRRSIRVSGFHLAILNRDVENFSHEHQRCRDHSCCATLFRICCGQLPIDVRQAS